MSQIAEIQKLIEELKNDDSEFIPFKKTEKLKQLLLERNDEEMLQFHYSLFSQVDNRELYYDVRSSFSERPKEIIEPFLLKKLKTVDNIDLKADIVQLLGSIGSAKILPFAKANITSENRQLRYRCIIVIGWVGGKEELPILIERLKNDPDDVLRGYAATAMRQMWFKKKIENTDALPYLYAAVKNETAT